MGQWKSERGFLSDAMADILGKAFKDIGNLEAGELWSDGKRQAVTPEPRIIDLADAIEFCSCGVFTVEIHPEAAGREEQKVSVLCCTNYDTIPNRGQIQREVCENACMDQETDTDEP